MKRKNYIALFLFAAFLLVLFFDWGSNPFSELSASDDLTLYSIDGKHYDQGKEPVTAEKIYRYPVLKKLHLQSTRKKQKLIDVLKQTHINPRITLVQTSIRCFEPGYIVSSKKEQKESRFFICLKCRKVGVELGESEWQFRRIRSDENIRVQLNAILSDPHQ